MENAKYSVIEPDQLLKAIKTENHWLIADVRPRHEFVTQHIPGSVNVPQALLPRLLETEGTDKRIILVCNNGKLARRTAFRLDKDYKNIYVLEGGVMLWRLSGFPTDHRMLTIPEEMQVDIIFGAGALFSAAMILSVSPILIGIGASLVAGSCTLNAAKKLSKHLANSSRKDRCLSAAPGLNTVE